MAWITPKTNWVATDYFNPEDYNRITGNIQYIKQKAIELWGNFQTPALSPDKNYASMIYASEMNNIENAVVNINANTYDFNLGESKTYAANNNSATLNYTDLNRIESAILRLKKTLDAQLECIPRLEFTLGTYGNFQV